jgi:Pin2-interacting protein X1
MLSLDKGRFLLIISSQPIAFNAKLYSPRIALIVRHPNPSIAMLLDKKTVKKLGSQLNHASASKPSSYAMKLMEKMGWKEGEGLGKNADGLSSHITMSKREDNLGLGLGQESKDEVAPNALAEHWWHMDFSAKLRAFSNSIQTDGDKKARKNKKRKRDNENDSNKSSKKSKKSSKKDEAESKEGEAGEGQEKKTKKAKHNHDVVTFEDGSLNYKELFKATGGARLGMRARREQKGKLLRTEGPQALII